MQSALLLYKYYKTYCREVQCRKDQCSRHTHMHGVQTLRMLALGVSVAREMGWQWKHSRDNFGTILIAIVDEVKWKSEVV